MKVSAGKLESLARVRTGKLDANASSPNGSYPFFTCATEPLRISNFTFDCECVLVAGNGDLNVKYYNGKFNAYQRTYVIESLDKTVLDVRYLYRFMDSYLEYLRRLSIGGVIKYIKLENLTKARIPLPPLPEQRRIVEILDKADELRAKRRATLAKLDSLTQSIFLDMFGDPDGHHWPMSTIADVAAQIDGSIRTGPFGSQLLHSEFTEEGIAVLGIDNVVNNEFQWAERRYISHEKYRELFRYTVHPGDVLITIMGTCGRCAVVPEDIPRAINTKHLCCITLDPAKCLPVFLHAYFLRHPIALRHLAQKAKGAIMEGLNMGIVRQMPIPLVPMELQVVFASRLKEISELRTSGQRSAMECDALFGSLQYRAFRGDL